MIQVGTGVNIYYLIYFWAAQSTSVSLRVLSSDIIFHGILKFEQVATQFTQEYHSKSTKKVFL